MSIDKCHQTWFNGLNAIHIDRYLGIQLRAASDQEGGRLTPISHHSKNDGHNHRYIQFPVLEVVCTKI